MPELPDDLAGLPVGEFAFPGPLRDRIVRSILDGSKTATAHLLVENEREGTSPGPEGAREVVVDSDDRPVAVIRYEAPEVVRLADVTDEHAVAEGEGYADAGQWRRGHERFWTSPEYLDAMGGPVALDDDAWVVCERFVVERVL